MPDITIPVAVDDRPAAAGPFDATSVRDVRFASPDGCDLFADLYLPQGLGRPSPVIIWLHGGAWRFGDRRLAPDLSRFFARAGFAMVSVDYRLSTQAKFPAAVEDVKTAIRWVRSVSERFDLNPNAIGLWGSSAGGHLAALAATSGPGAFESMTSAYADCSSDVQAVVDGYGPTDFLQLDAHRDPHAPPSDDPETIRLPAGLRSADAQSPESLLIGGPIQDHADLVRRANPMTYVAAGQPPFLILHGLSDPAVPAHQSELLFNALTRTDNDVTLALVERLGHGFLNRNHLDDGAPWSIRLRSHPRGGPIDRTDVQSGIFTFIETFFRKHLVG
jgi:acetyl esterase/lipase